METSEVKTESEALTVNSETLDTYTDEQAVNDLEKAEPKDRNAPTRPDTHSFFYSNLVRCAVKQATIKKSKRKKGKIVETSDRSVEGKGGEGKSGNGVTRIVSYIGDIMNPRPAHVFTAPLLWGAVVKYLEQHSNVVGLIGKGLPTTDEAEAIARQLPNKVFIPVNWFSTEVLKRGDPSRRVYEGMENACNDLADMKYLIDYTNGDQETVTVFEKNTKHKRDRIGVTLTFSASFLAFALVKGWFKRVHLSHLLVGLRDGKDFAFSMSLNDYLSNYKNLSLYIENGGYINLKLTTVLDWMGDFPTLSESGESKTGEKDTLGKRKGVVDKVLTPLNNFLKSLEGRGISASIVKDNTPDAEPVLDDEGKFISNGERCTRQTASQYYVRIQYSPTWIQQLIEDRPQKERDKLNALFIKNRILEKTQSLDVKRLS